jgi:hypothetical protein
MKQMVWFRLHSEARNDPKLDLLSDAQFRVWFRLLCFASDQTERGIVNYRSLKLLAVQVARGDEKLLEETLTLLAELEVIEWSGNDVEFVNWMKRQYDSPSDYPEAARDRKRKQRDKEKNVPINSDVTNSHDHNIPVSRDVTNSHDVSRSCARRERERDREIEERDVEETRATRDKQKITTTTTDLSPEMQFQQAANLFSDSVKTIYHNYAEPLRQRNRDIFLEAKLAREKYPHLNASVLNTWMRNLLKEPILITSKTDQQEGDGYTFFRFLPDKTQYSIFSEADARASPDIFREQAERLFSCDVYRERLDEICERFPWYGKVRKEFDEFQRKRVTHV